MQYEVEFLTDGCYNDEDTEYFISHWSDTKLIGNTIIYEDDCLYLRGRKIVLKWPCSWIKADDLDDGNMKAKLIEDGWKKTFYFSKGLQKIAEEKIKKASRKASTPGKP
jgi:hypothetical protein